MLNISQCVASVFSDCTTRKKCQNVSLNGSLQLKLHFEKQQKRKQGLNFSWGLMKHKILPFSPHLILKHYLILCRKNEEALKDCVAYAESHS